MKQGVIQKDPHSVPVVSNVRAVATYGTRRTRIHQNLHDDDDEFDL